MEIGELGSQYFLNEVSSETALHNSMAWLNTQHINPLIRPGTTPPLVPPPNPSKARIKVLRQFGYGRNSGTLNIYHISLIVKSDTH